MNFTKDPFQVKKFKFLLLAFIYSALLSTGVSVSQNKMDGKITSTYPIGNPKVDLKTRQVLIRLPADSSLAVWVLFRDKGIKSSAEYKCALDKCLHQLSERSIKRRIKRGQTPLVDFSDIPVKREYLNELENLGVRIRVVSRWLNAASVLANRQQIQKLTALPFVRKIKKVATFTRREPKIEDVRPKKMRKDFKLYALRYGESYAQLAQIHVPELHDIGLSGEGVLITLLDTGFFIDHPAFKHILNSGRLKATHDFINGDDDVDDQDDNQRWHGTAVFSVVGGFVEDTLIGGAYGAEFALAKTEIREDEIQIEEDYWVAGVEWADSLGADIVSSSLGYNDWYTYEDMNGDSALCTQAADLAVSKGIVVINAAGNERRTRWHYIIAPADGDSVIAVGAVDLEGKIASFSSVGPTYDGRIKPDVTALGVGTYCGVTGGGYNHLDGTSFATPLVAGACALLLEAHPDWTPIQLREALWSSASQADHPDTLMGYGIVNAAKASGFSYLVVTPQKLYFETAFGDTLSQESILEVTNWQGEGLKWRAYTSANWISLLPDSGFTSDLLVVMVHPASLRPGINSDSIMISAEDAINSPLKVSVVFLLRPHTQVLTFPNPFSDSLTVIVKNPQAQNQVKVSVFTVAGELVHRFPGEVGKEMYQHIWDGKNEKGREVGNGVYLLKVDIGNQSQIVKVAKIK